MEELRYFYDTNGNVKSINVNVNVNDKRIRYPLLNYNMLSSTLTNINKFVLTNDGKLYESNNINIDYTRDAEFLEHQKMEEDIKLIMVDINDSHPPYQPVFLPDNVKLVTAISSTYNSAVVLAQNGLVYARGENFYGQLGTGDILTQDKFVQSAVCNDLDVVQVFTSIKDRTFVITREGLLYYFGYGRFGNSARHKITLTPTLIHSLRGLKINYVTESANNTAVITNTGALLIRGNNLYGQLSVGRVDKLEHINFVPVNNFTVKNVSIGGSTVVFVTTDGLLYIIGNKIIGSRSSFSSIPNFSSTPIFSSNPNSILNPINANPNLSFTTIVEGGGIIFSWQDINMIALEPTNIPVNNETIETVAIAPNGNHIAILTEDGKLYTYGDNMDGRLGLGDEIQRDTFTLVNLPFKVKSVYTTDTNTIIISDVDDGEKVYIAGMKGKRLSVDEFSEKKQRLGIYTNIYVDTNVFNLIEEEYQYN